MENSALLEIISQIGIGLFGVTAIILISKKNKWGFVFGLAGQPFWLYSSFTNKQWGILFLCLVYTVSWSYGIYQWFFKAKKLDSEKEAMQ